MLLEKENWRMGYNQILKDCRPRTTTAIPSSSGSSVTSGGTALILCNLDADALCAARILSYAFRADNVVYQLRPCGGCTRLIRIIERLNANAITDEYDDDNEESINGDRRFQYKSATTSTIRAIILLNLGATKNLVRMLFSSIPILNEEGEETGILKPPLLRADQTKVHILDSHRPYHLANVHAPKNVVLWNDFEHWNHGGGMDGDGGLPSDGDGLSGDDDSSSSSEDDDSDEDEEDSDEETEGEKEAEFEDETVEGSTNVDGADDTSVEERSALHQREDTHYDGDKDDDDHDNDDRDNGDHEDFSAEKARKRSSSISSSSSSSNNEVKRRRQEGQDTAPTQPTTSEYDADDLAEEHIHDRNDDAEDPERGVSQGAQSALTAMTNASTRDQRKSRRNRIRRYYTSGSYHSSPISYMSYTLLSTQLRFDSVGDLLWLACIGVTDAYIHNRLDLSGYAMFAMDLKRHVRRVYPDLNDGADGILERSANAFYAESLYDTNGANGAVSAGPQTQVGHSENGRILAQNDEFRFFLLRHASLWEAMRLSPHVCTKMELWRNAGIQKLKEMLAKMGLPLTQCQQPYAFMKPKSKRRLKELILQHAEGYGLDNISYTGFVRVTGYKSLLSASDMSLAVTALLECETPNTCNFSNEVTDDDEDEDVNSKSKFADEEEEERCLTQSFNIAYDALNSNGTGSTAIGLGSISGIGIHGEGSNLSNLVNGGQLGGSSGLGAGICLAMSLQKSIISTAVSLVERKAITRLTHFRYAYLNCTSQGATGISSTTSSGTWKKSSVNSGSNSQHPHHLFAKPLALTKLAYFLMDMHRANKKWTGTKARPLVLMAEKPQSQSYVVVGYEFPEQNGNVVKNRFGQNFELASKVMQGTFKFDSFDSNVVEVKGSDVQKFIEQLHFMMDSV